MMIYYWVVYLSLLPKIPIVKKEEDNTKCLTIGKDNQTILHTINKIRSRSLRVRGNLALRDTLYTHHFQRYLAREVNAGMVFRQRTCCEVEDGDRWWWRREKEEEPKGENGYLCNPGTAPWEMVREARACIPGHVLAHGARHGFTVHLHKLARRIDRSLAHPARDRSPTQPPISWPRTNPPQNCDICDIVETRGRKMFRSKRNEAFAYKENGRWFFTVFASRAFWELLRPEDINIWKQEYITNAIFIYSPTNLVWSLHGKRWCLTMPNNEFCRYIFNISGEELVIL